MGGGGGVGEVQGVEFDGVGVEVEVVVVVVVVVGGGREAVVVCCAVGGCAGVGGGGGRGAELVDFDAHEGEGGPGGEGPWSTS